MNLLTATLHRAFRTTAAQASSATSAHIPINHFASMAQQQSEIRHPEANQLLEESRHPKRSEGPPYSAPQPHSHLWKATHRLPPVLTLAIGTAALSIIAFFWLEIPDSHTWQLTLSLLIAAALTAGFLAIYATTIRRIRAATTTPLWLSLIVLAAWLLVAWLLTHLIAHIEPGMSDRAGYLNSKLSPQLRATFTYARLMAWQQDLVLILDWVILPALLLPFIIETIARGLSKIIWTTAARTLRRWQHWLAVIILGHLGLWLTSRLTTWHPTYTVHGELISIALRLGLVYLLDLLLLVLVLAFDAELLARASTPHDVSRNPTP